MKRTTVNDTLPKLLLNRAKERPDKVAIRAKELGIWKVRTWKDFASDVRDIAFGLSRQGLKRGDHVALLGDLDWRLFCSITAIQSLGGIVVPIAADAVSRQICRYISESNVSMAIAEDQEQVDKLMDVKSDCDSLTTIIYIKHQGVDLYDRAGLISFDEITNQGADASWFEREIETGSGDDRAVVFHELNEDGEQCLLATTHNNWISAAHNASGKLNLTETDELFCSMPPGFCWSILFYQAQHIYKGYRISFPETHSTVQSDMREIGPTVCFMTPRAYRHISVQTAHKIEDSFRIKRGLFQYFMNWSAKINRPGAAQTSRSVLDKLAFFVGSILFFAPLKDFLGLSRVRMALSLVDSVSPSVLEFYRSLGVPIKQFYGPTTACGFLSVQQGSILLEEDNVGLPVDDMEIGISERSEILFRGPHALHHEWQAPGTSSSLGEELEWVRSGDAGRLEQDGTLRIFGRVRELGKLKNGVDFVPKIIERKVSSCTYVKHCLAIGHDREFVAILVVLDPDAIRLWAERNGIIHASYADLVSRSEVYDLVRTNISGVNQELVRERRDGLQVRRLAILTEELDICAGELSSHTRRACRAAIMKKHAMLIDALFSDTAWDRRRDMDILDAAAIDEKFISSVA